MEGDLRNHEQIKKNYTNGKLLAMIYYSPGTKSRSSVTTSYLKETLFNSLNLPCNFLIHLYTLRWNLQSAYYRLLTSVGKVAKHCSFLFLIFLQSRLMKSNTCCGNTKPAHNWFISGGSAM